MTNKKITPRRNELYSLREIKTKLDLDDSPSLGFVFNGMNCCIQTSHVNQVELLSVPGLAETMWRYMYTTNEWIPVFECAERDNALETCLDFEVYLESDGPTKYFWATPKGFPRKQYYADVYPLCVEQKVKSNYKPNVSKIGEVA